MGFRDLSEDTPAGKADAGAIASADQGIVIAGKDGSDNAQFITTDADGHLQVDALTGGGGTQYTEGDTDTTITGTAALMEGASSTLLPIQGTVADGLLVNLGTNNDVSVTGTVAVTQSGTWDEVGINDSGNSITVDNGGTFAAQVTAVPRSEMGPAQPGTAVDSYATVAINLTTGADQVLVASAASKQIWVYGYAFSCGDAAGQTVSLQDQDDVALTGIMEFAQYGGIAVSPSGNFSMPVFKLGTDKDLEIDITGGDVDGWLSYAIISV